MRVLADTPPRSSIQDLQQHLDGLVSGSFPVLLDLFRHATFVLTGSTNMDKLNVIYRLYGPGSKLAQHLDAPVFSV